MSKPRRSPDQFPRTCAMVAQMLRRRHGIKLSAQGVRDAERRALAKLRAALLPLLNSDQLEAAGQEPEARR